MKLGVSGATPDLRASPRGAHLATATPAATGLAAVHALESRRRLTRPKRKPTAERPGGGRRVGRLMAPSIAIDIHPEDTAARVDVVNTFRCIRKSFHVVSRRFALSNSVFPQVTGPFAAGSIPGSSTSVYAGRRGISELPPRRWHGPLGGFGFIGPCDGVMAGREVSSAFRQIRVVDYAFQPAAIARHWAQHALRGTDARRPAVRRAPHDGGATCSMCRRLLPVLADAASTGPTSPLPPDVGFTRARHGRVLTGSTVRCG